MSEGTTTYVLMRTREDAVEAMRKLQAEGWDIYATNIPLRGQVGFKCVSPLENEGSGFTQRSHCIFWNIYDAELTPLVIDCDGEYTLLSFVLAHGHHDSFGFFEYPNDDVGFVCYCQGHNGRSCVLRIPEGLELNETASEFIWAYQSQT